MTQKAYDALKKQKVQDLEIQLKGKVPLEEYKNLVFVTKNNKPTQQFIVQANIKSVYKPCTEVKIK